MSGDDEWRWVAMGGDECRSGQSGPIWATHLQRAEASLSRVAFDRWRPDRHTQRRPELLLPKHARAAVLGIEARVKTHVRHLHAASRPSGDHREIIGRSRTAIRWLPAACAPRMLGDLPRVSEHKGLSTAMTPHVQGAREVRRECGPSDKLRGWRRRRKLRRCACEARVGCGTLERHVWGTHTRQRRAREVSARTRQNTHTSGRRGRGRVLWPVQALYASTCSTSLLPAPLLPSQTGGTRVVSVVRSEWSLRGVPPCVQWR